MWIGSSGYVSDTYKERVRERALSLGFVACGFTSAGPLASNGVLEGWIAAERHGYMDYLARAPERRIAPRSVLPSANSVVVVAWPYRPAPRPTADWRERLTGRIAAYALGRDYHDVLPQLLSELAREVQSVCGGRSRVHVDAGPLVEKELARRAGLGWFGRNTNILLREAGSWVLLGCLLTEARFSPDPPFAADHCGTCRACVPACPTGALSSGPTIDARLCISYLTIEHRGPIDKRLRPKIENWVFGCDLCQDVCPWGDDRERCRADELAPSLPDLLRLSADEFRQRYGATAVARAKRRGLARNAAIALGNSGNRAAVEHLAWALREHDEPLVRAHAAWALGRIGGTMARRELDRAWACERVPPVQEEVAAASAEAGADAGTGFSAAQEPKRRGLR